jgi:hypothetical protein
MTRRLRQNATIRRASWQAQADANRLDARILKQLEDIYRAVLTDIQAQISNYAGINSVVGINNLQRIMQSVNYQLGVLGDQRTALLNAGMRENAEIAANVFSSIVDSQAVLSATNDAVRTARNFIAADGLQLSDRLWRVDNQATQKIGLAIQSAIIQGQSASQAAQDFVNRGLPIPADIRNKMSAANVQGINRAIAYELVNSPDSVYANVKRVFRTEINRAHVTAYQQSLEGVDDVVGTRFLLSRNHPERDICDMHARANIYGLGPGVYPLGKSPLPAHPNTLSYEVAVFEEEVSSVHKANRQSRSEWLASQPPSVQAKVLNSWGKQRAFNAGLLSENGFTTPWKMIKKRLERKGIDVKNLPRSPAPKIAALNSHPNPYAIRDVPEYINGNIEVRRALNQYVTGIGLKGLSVKNLNSVYAAMHVVLGRFGLEFKTLRWTNEPGVGGFFNSSELQQMALGRSIVTASFREPGYNIPNFMAGKEGRISELKQLLRAAPEEHKDLIRQQLVRELMAFRHGVSDDANDVIFAVMAHEAGHTLFRAKGLAMPWHFALKANGVNYADHALVSHYAAFNESELFSEVTSLLAQGREGEIPSGILSAYNQVVDLAITHG